MGRRRPGISTRSPAYAPAKSDRGPARGRGCSANRDEIPATSWSVQISSRRTATLRPSRSYCSVRQNPRPAPRPRTMSMIPSTRKEGAMSIKAERLDELQRRLTDPSKRA
jgi:hypothetical protein